MLETFVPPRDLLVSAAADSRKTPDASLAVAPQDPIGDEDALADVWRFRAGLRDAFDVMRERLPREIASEVLARELLLEPCDIAAVVDRATQRIGSPLKVRIRPSDAGALAEHGVRVVGDASLRSGDAVLEVRDGTIDVSLGDSSACCARSRRIDRARSRRGSRGRTCARAPSRLRCVGGQRANLQRGQQFRGSHRGSSRRRSRYLDVCYVSGISRGDVVECGSALYALPLGTCALGRAIDAVGKPLDDGAVLRGRECSVRSRNLDPCERAPLHEPLWTSIRVLDGLLTSARGARAGIFGAPGTGKSAFVHAVAAQAHADAVVVGLIGERGREAETWIHACAPHITVVCATGDRVARPVGDRQHRALRGGLARSRRYGRRAGWARRFPASVFAQLARTLEIAGASRGGSMTLLATVLDDGDARDPISDAARSMLDGHVMLSSSLAQAGHFPAVDVPASSSRTMQAVASPEHAKLAARARRAGLAGSNARGPRVRHQRRPAAWAIVRWPRRPR